MAGSGHQQAGTLTILETLFQDTLYRLDRRLVAYELNLRLIFNDSNRLKCPYLNVPKKCSICFRYILSHGRQYTWPLTMWECGTWGLSIGQDSTWGSSSIFASILLRHLLGTSTPSPSMLFFVGGHLVVIHAPSDLPSLEIEHSIWRLIFIVVIDDLISRSKFFI